MKVIPALKSSVFLGVIKTPLNYMQDGLDYILDGLDDMEDGLVAMQYSAKATLDTLNHNFWKLHAARDYCREKRSIYREKVSTFCALSTRLLESPIIWTLLDLFAFILEDHFLYHAHMETY